MATIAGLIVALSTLAGHLALEDVWINPPRLHHPTASSVTLAAVPAVDLELRVAPVGAAPGAWRLARADELWWQRVDLFRAADDGLDVVVETRAPDRSGPTTAHGPYLLRALPGAGETLRLAIASDTHAWAMHSKANTAKIRKAMENIATADPPYHAVVHNGDFTMTHCTGCLAVPPDATTGHVASLAEARHRTRVAWGPEYLGRPAEVPAMAVMGDHEGLAPWQSLEGPADLGAWSAEALADTLPPMPTHAHGDYRVGPPGTLSWAIRAGDVLLIGLDVHSAMVHTPLTADDWHLAPDHLAWFAATLAESDATHKVVIAEHVLGGVSSPDGTHWKARSSIKATQDGSVDTPFIGGQADVHAAMVQHGGDLFFVGHDHVAAWGTKDGVAYVTGGRAGGVSAPWHQEGWFRDALDYDGDGVPEFETDETGGAPPTGSRKSGHFELVAHPGGPLVCTYVRADVDPAKNEQHVVTFEIAP